MSILVLMYIFIVDVSLKVYKFCYDIELLYIKLFYENYIFYIYVYCENNKNSWFFLCFLVDLRFLEFL